MVSEWREFLYLNTRLVDNFIEAIDDGIHDESHRRSSTDHGKSKSAGLKAGPIQGDLGKSIASREEVEQVLRHTPVSRYNRLHKYLAESNELITVDADFDFSNLVPRTIVTAECYVDVPAVSRIMRGADKLKAVADFTREFSTDGATSASEEIYRQLDGLSKLNQAMGTGTTFRDLGVVGRRGGGSG